MAQFDYQSLIAGLSEDGFDSAEFVRQLVERGYQELIDAGAAVHIGAERHERTSTRKNRRNGSRRRTLATRAGDIEIALPKLRTGSYYPEFLERRRRIDKALYGVVMTSYLEGVSTRKVDELVKSLGIQSGISRSEVSRICEGIDEMVAAFRERDLSGTAYPYLYVDATYVKARSGHQVRSRAVAIAMAVNADGRRELLGIEIGRGEDQVFWEEFLTSLNERGLRGVKLVISDAHAAIASAVQKLLPDAAWQACPHPLRTQHRPQGKARPAPAGAGGLLGDLRPARPRTRQIGLPRLR